MAQITGTFSSYDSVGNREDLEDSIYDISPTATPFMSNGGRGDASAVLHEWQVDSLAAADTDNAQVEGDEVTSYDTASPTTRLGNYNQISRKTALVTGTQEAVRSAGRPNEMAYQLAKRSKELKRDMESIALANQATAAGDDSTARTTGSILAFLKTNTSVGSNGADPTYGSTPTDTRSDGDQRTFTETILKDVVAQTWESGGEPTVLMVGSYNKQKVSGFEGIADIRKDVPGAEQATIIGAADVYVSDFGNLQVVPNRFMRARDALVLDPSMYSFNFLRTFRTEEHAKTADGEKRVILVEWSLQVNNEAAHGIAADLRTEDA